MRYFLHTLVKLYFVRQIALVDILNALDVHPDSIVGHSLGELACAYADGCLSAEQVILTAYWRGRCVFEADLPPGAMAAVGEQLRQRTSTYTTFDN